MTNQLAEPLWCIFTGEYGDLWMTKQAFPRLRGTNAPYAIVFLPVTYRIGHLSSTEYLAAVSSQEEKGLIRMMRLRNYDDTLFTPSLLKRLPNNAN